MGERQSPENSGDKSLETRLNERLHKINESVRSTTNELLENGHSERALGALLSMHEYVDQMVREGVGLAGGKEMDEKFIVEIQSGLRRLYHGLTMGVLHERSAERAHLAANPGVFRSAIARALRESNGSGKIGPSETIIGYETVI